jgi:carbon monoxide dehydrogenase subunit G
MELNHEFTVHRPIEETWRVLTDVERIAPCLPGAQLQEVEGDVFRGVVKVKVGPIQAQFKGQASFVEQDDQRHHAVLKAEGRDTGGKGNASALITAHLEAVSPTVTTCTVLTDLSITGKVAQFGRGALADVSDKLLAQFSNNLNALLEQQPAAEAAAEVEAEVAPPSAEEPEGEPAADTEPTATVAELRPAVRRIDAPEAEPVDLLETAGMPLLKRILPLVAGAVLVLILLRWRRRR